MQTQTKRKNFIPTEMKRLQLTFTLLAFVLTIFAQTNDVATPGGTQNIWLSPVTTKSAAITPSSNELFNNGSFVNSPGTGAGGADESVLQSYSLGMIINGFGFQTSAGNSVADDFTFTKANEISQIKVYAYQTGSSTTSTITAVYLQIYDGQPGAGGNVIWGDMSTNRLNNSTWTGTYRVEETTSGNTDRPIMECVCDVNTTLQAGTYWLEIQVDGSLSSGPWCPPVTITGNNTTGNAIRYGSWESLLDSGTNTPQGVPFVITGFTVVPLNPAYIFGLFALLAVSIVVKRRFF